MGREKEEGREGGTLAGMALSASAARENHAEIGAMVKTLKYQNNSS